MVVTANLPGPPNPGIERALLEYLEREAININPGQPNEERTSLRVEECYHDETPGSPCSIYLLWQLSTDDP